MSRTLLSMPWIAHGHLLRRAREIASILSRHGLGWLLAQVGLSGLVPFQRGWLGHPKRETPYTQAEHLRLVLSILLAATIIALGLVMLVYHPPGWEQVAGWVFGLAFLFSLGVGAWLMWNIWRSGRG